MCHCPPPLSEAAVLPCGFGFAAVRFAGVLPFIPQASSSRRRPSIRVSVLLVKPGRAMAIFGQVLVPAGAQERRGEGRSAWRLGTPLAAKGGVCRARETNPGFVPGLGLTRLSRRVLALTQGFPGEDLMPSVSETSRRMLTGACRTPVRPFLPGPRAGQGAAAGRQGGRRGRPGTNPLKAFLCLSSQPLVIERLKRTKASRHRHDS